MMGERSRTERGIIRRRWGCSNTIQCAAFNWDH
jgi:hypothetical protein